MTSQAKAQIIYTSAVEFLAKKYGTTEAVVYQAINEKNPAVMESFLDLVTEAIMSIDRVSAEITATA